LATYLFEGDISSAIFVRKVSAAAGVLVMAAGLQFKNRRARLKLFCSAAAGLLAAAIVSGTSSGVRAQQKDAAEPARPIRTLTVQGQVSLPEGMPAGRALVTLTTTSGVPHQTYTNDFGKFEFPGIEEGGYTLTARSINDPNLVAERVETDTSRTATSNLNVNLILRREAVRRAEPAEVINAIEADQKVPSSARKAFKEGLKLTRDNKPDGALERLNRAVELDPDYFQALAARGDLRILRRELTEAAADFARALKINPRYGPALHGAGYCKLEQREFAAAIKVLEQATTAQPDNANNYLLLGIAYLELDRREPARLALFKALTSNSPHELRAHIYLGNLYAREHLYKEAADELHKYLAAYPTAPDAANIKAIETEWRTRAASP
jgi:tetratricopeptide (TPR) repeat protein